MTVLPYRRHFMATLEAVVGKKTGTSNAIYGAHIRGSANVMRMKITGGP